MFATSNEKLLLLLLDRCYRLAPNKWVKAAVLFETLKQFPALAELLDAHRGGADRELRELTQNAQVFERDGAYQISNAGSWTAKRYRVPKVIEPDMTQIVERLIHVESA